MLHCDIGLVLVLLLRMSLAQATERTDVDINDARVQRYARMAIIYLNDRNRRDGLPLQELNGVKSAQQQVVSAIYYYITMTVRQVGCAECPPQSCEATVFYQSWTHTEQVMAMECVSVTTTAQSRMVASADARASVVKARAAAVPINVNDIIPAENTTPVETRDNFAKGNTPPLRNVAKFAVHQYNKQSDILYNYSLEHIVSFTKTAKVKLGIKYNLILTLGNPTCKLASLAKGICRRPRHEMKRCRASVWYRSWLDLSRQYQVLGTVDCTTEQTN